MQLMKISQKLNPGDLNGTRNSKIIESDAYTIIPKNPLKS